MHVAIICDALTPQDPAGQQAAALAVRLADLGYRVSLLCSQAIEPDLDERIELRRPERLPRFRAAQLIVYRRWVFRTLQAVLPDARVSFSETIPAEVMAPVRGTHRALVDEQADCMPPVSRPIARLCAMRCPLDWLSLLFERRAYRAPSVQAVCAISQRIASQIDALVQADKPETRRVALPLQTWSDFDQPASPKRKQLARGLRVNLDAKWIVFFFRSASLGGFDAMIGAFKALVDSGVDAILFLAGPTRYTHLAWIAQLGLRERVRFVGGSDQLGTLAASADLVAHPTLYDPGGWGLQPALAAGRPIITTTASDAGDLVRQRGGVVLDCPVDAGALLSAMRDRLSDETEAVARDSEGETRFPRSSPDPTLAEAIEAFLAGFNPSGSV